MNHLAKALTASQQIYLIKVGLYIWTAFISATEEDDYIYPSSDCDGDVAFRAVLLMKFRISLKYESSLSSKMALLLSSSERGDDIAVPTQQTTINIIT